MSVTLSRRRVLTASAAAGLGLAAAPLGVGRAAGTTATSPPQHQWSNTRARQQSAFLNHTYTALDRTTADAVATNACLREFGAFQLRTTTNADTTYSGRYLLGRQTYLEMFAEGDLPAPDDQRGATGLALSPDRVGTIDAIKRRMIALGATDPLDVVQTKVIDDAQVPWFRVVAPSTTYQAAFPWVMEYLESYFANPRTHSEPASFPGDVSRERYNSDDYRRKTMRDVIGVEFGAPASDLKAIEITLRAAGLRVRSSGSGLIATGRSEHLRVEAVPRDRAGWRRIDFALNHDCRRRRTERIGASTLRVGPGRHAHWTFDRP